MKTFYGYARKSTEGQNEASLEVQIDSLKKIADELGMIFESIQETGSGRNISSRPKLNEMLQTKIKRGDAVGVYDSSRLSRNELEAFAIYQDLSEKGVDIYVNGKKVDLTNPQDRMMVGIQASFDAYSVNIQKDKSLKGIQKVKANGDWLFTGRMLGYQIIGIGSRRRVEIVPEEADIIKYLFTEYAKGRSINSIAKSLNNIGKQTKGGCIFNPATIRRTLKKPIYKGFYALKGPGAKVGQDKIPYDENNMIKSNLYPPIISPKLWNAVQNSYRTVHRTHAIQYSYNYAGYELSSIIHCKGCEGLGAKSSFVHCHHKTNHREDRNESYVDLRHVKGCPVHRCTLNSKIYESLFRFCFYLLFMDSSELSSFLDKKRKEAEAFSRTISEQIIDVEKQLKLVIQKQMNVENLVINTGEWSDNVRNRLDALKVEESRLKNALRDLKYSQHLSEEQMTFMVGMYTEESLANFLLADKPAIRRQFYLDMMESAYVDVDDLVISYKNGKKFKIGLGITRRGRNLQEVFNVEVFFNDQFQFQARIDTQAKELRIIKTRASVHYTSLNTEWELTAVKEYKQRYDNEWEVVKDNILSIVSSLSDGSLPSLDW